MHKPYRILMGSTLPLAAPWNLADKNLAATLVEQDPFNHFIVQTNLSQQWPQSNVTAIRSRFAGDRTTFAQKVLSFSHLLHQTRSADIVHVVATLQGTSKWVGPLMRKWFTVWKRPIVHTAPSIGDFTVDPRNLIGDVTVVVSEHTKQRLEQAGVSRVFRVYPPLDVARIRPRVSPHEIAKQYELGERAVLYPAHYGEHSGIREIIRAFADLPPRLNDSVLVFACRSYPWQNPEAEAANVMMQATEAGIASRVRVVGTVNDVPAWMKACAVTALIPQRLASKMDLPYVFMEALVLERPVILGNTPPISEALFGGGFAVPYGDIAALRDALVGLLEDAELRQQLALQGRAEVLKYCSPDQVVKQYQQIYQLAYSLGKQHDSNAETMELP